MRMALKALGSQRSRDRDFDSGLPGQPRQWRSRRRARASRARHGPTRYRQPDVESGRGTRRERLEDAVGARNLTGKARQACRGPAIFSCGAAKKPDAVSVINNLALSYALDGKPEKSEDLLRKAVASGNEDKRVRQNLALVLGLQGKFDEARQVAAVDMTEQEAKSSRPICGTWCRTPTSSPRPSRPARTAAPATTGSLSPQMTRLSSKTAAARAECRAEGANGEGRPRKLKRRRPLRRRPKWQKPRAGNSGQAESGRHAETDHAGQCHAGPSQGRGRRRRAGRRGGPAQNQHRLAT